MTPALITNVVDASGQTKRLWLPPIQMQAEGNRNPYSLFLICGLAPFIGFLWSTSNLWQAHTRRVRRQPKGLSELPLEITTEILKLLDWGDVLRVRQTCKLLAGATKAKPLWINLFNVSNTCHPYSPLRLDRPMQLYTAQELEYLVLRRASAEILRKSQPELLPTFTRPIPIDTSRLRAISMINGGRWLLIASAAGSVAYCDLDAQDSSGARLLIPEQLEYSSDYMHDLILDIDIDNEFTLLSFNLAMVMIKSKYEMPRIHLTQIWRVTLEVDNTCGASLSATLLSCFHREDCGLLASLSVLGPLIAFGVEASSLDETPSHISIVDWTEAEIHNRSQPKSLSYHRKVIFCPNKPYNIRLLPGNRLLVLSSQFIGLYDITSIEVTANIPPDPVHFPSRSACTVSSWETDISWLSPWPTLSETYLYRHANAMRLTFIASEAVHGLVIPFDPLLGQDPCLVKLMDFRVRDGKAITSGYNSAIIHSRQPRLHLLHYSWLDSSFLGHSNSLVVECGGDVWIPHISAFDEGSGRAVVCRKGEALLLSFAKFQ